MTEIKLNNNGNESHKEYKIIPYTVTRTVLEKDDVANLATYERHKNTPTENFKDCMHHFKFKNFIYDTIPVLKWLPGYSFKNNLVGDIISGITVAVMHIPQGMAYGLLAGLYPVVGLYMAFFPTLVYFIFGTSRHISTGTFAIVSLMTSKIVTTYSNQDLPLNQTLIDTGGTEELARNYTPVEVATATTMMVGIFHLLMSFFRLGTLTSLLSEPLVNGFTTAAAFHVIMSQSKDILGITIPRHKGAFKIILSIRDTILNISSTNMAAVYVSIVCAIFMIIMNEIVKPWMSKRSKIPMPAELLAVVGGTIASYFLELGPNYNVRLVGEIPTGLPTPTLPPLELLKDIAVDSIGVTIVSYSIVISMALTFSRKLQYEVRANQELLAMGLANIVGSFFTCIPLACSLSRSLIQQQTGGKTQIASVVSAALILVLLLWMGPLFETLPRAVLGAIIIVALKGMIMQIKDLKRFHKEGILEVAVWVTTFVAVVIIDIDIGLLAGVLVSLFALYMKGYKSYSCMLGVVPNTDVYVDLTTHRKALEVPTIKIFRYVGAVNFTSRSTFKKALMTQIGVDHRIIRRASVCEQGEAKFLTNMRTLIIDFSATPHIDISGCKTLTEINTEMDLLSVKFLLASPNDCVYDALLHSSAIGVGTFQIFATIHDAVLYSQDKLEL